MITMNTDYTDAMLTVPLGDGQVVLTNKVTDPSDNTVTLYFKNDQLISIDQAHHKATATRTIIITPPRNLESKKIALYVNELATAAKIKLESSMTARLTDDQRKPIKEYWAEVEPLLLLLGIKVTGNKKNRLKRNIVSRRLLLKYLSILILVVQRQLSIGKSAMKCA